MAGRTYGTLASVADGTGRRWWQITAEPHVAIRLRRILPRVTSRSGALLVADTLEVCRDLAWVLDRWPLAMELDTAKTLHGRADEHAGTEDAVRAILDGSAPPLALAEPARAPRAYQTQPAEIVLATGRLLLADEVGLGKSLESLLVLRDPAALPALIVTLAHLPRQWLGELEATLPWLHGHIVTSVQPYDPGRRRGSPGGRQPDVLIMSYHMLRGWADILAGKVRTLILDEAHELRHDDTQKYRAAAQVADRAAYRMAVTATPVWNYGGEIHNVVNIIAPDALGTREEFAREWCGSVDRAGANQRKLVVADPAALGTYLRDQGIMLRRTRKDVGRELPDVVTVPHTVDTDTDVIDSLTEDAVAMAETILQRSAPTGELFRVAGDFDWRLRHATGVAKAPYVAEFVKLLAETGEQVVLFGWHRDVYGIWAQRLGKYHPVFYTGSESSTQKRASKERFTSGESRVLVMSLRSGAGLDGLQKVANVVVFGELDWSPEIHHQCVGRVNRDGVGGPVVAYYLMSDHGSDPVVAQVLALKRRQAEPIRDPSVPVVASAATAADRVRLLAAEFLRRRGRPVPEPVRAAATTVWPRRLTGGAA